MNTGSKRIDWKNPKTKLSKHFTVKEAIWLPAWGRLANDADGLGEDAKAALIGMFWVMDKVREFVGLPIVVHCAFRPQLYNKLVGGAEKSAHMARMEHGRLIAAVDFHAKGEPPNETRILLLPKLNELDVRMEDLPGSNWVHVDTQRPGSTRYFRP